MAGLARCSTAAVASRAVASDPVTPPARGRRLHHGGREWTRGREVVMLGSADVCLNGWSPAVGAGHRRVPLLRRSRPKFLGASVRKRYARARLPTTRSATRPQKHPKQCSSLTHKGRHAPVTVAYRRGVTPRLQLRRMRRRSPHTPRRVRLYAPLAPCRRPRRLQCERRHLPCSHTRPVKHYVLRLPPHFFPTPTNVAHLPPTQLALP